ncbi:MAG: hypothetical protein GY859_05940, partial [Desulfobacterales bacterium]|nr:hypothetical protein [Desulfobacterales bacterium]
GYWILFASSCGEMETADRHFDEGMAQSAEIEDETFRTFTRTRLMYAKGWRWLYAGDFRKSLEMAERGRALMTAASNQRWIAIFNQLFAAVLYFLGRFEEGRDHAEEGLKIMREKGFRDVSFSWQLLLSARNCLELGEIERARARAEEGMGYFREMGNPQGRAYAWLALYTVHMKTGDLHAAESALRSGIGVIKDLDLPLIEGGLKGSLARLLIDQGRFRE